MPGADEQGESCRVRRNGLIAMAAGAIALCALCMWLGQYADVFAFLAFHDSPLAGYALVLAFVAFSPKFLGLIELNRDRAIG